MKISFHELFFNAFIKQNTRQGMGFYSYSYLQNKCSPQIFRQHFIINVDWLTGDINSMPIQMVMLIIVSLRIAQICAKLTAKPIGQIINNFH